MDQEGEESVPARDGPNPEIEGRRSVRRASVALAGVCSRLPHLSGLATAVELRSNWRHVQTACVTPSGLILVNPGWFNRLSEDEALFVIAHELLHLALEHHERGGETEPAKVNVAADCIVNDLLREELGCELPEGALDRPGARHFALERLLLELCEPLPEEEFNSIGRALGSLAAGEPSAETSRSSDPLQGDLVPADVERRWFPEESGESYRRRKRVAREVARIAPLSVAVKRLRELESLGSGGRHRWADPRSRSYDSTPTSHVPPWQLALRESLEEVLPPARSYARASRRQGSLDPGLVLPGRVCPPALCLVVVLDTSGSMSDAIREVLGVVASFCRAAGVSKLRVLQCDVEVEADEWLSPEDLESYRIRGFGGSDMSPAMERLGRDPEVRAAVVVTDGWIGYPDAPMPYEVIWAVTKGPPSSFRPSYGHVVEVGPAERD